MTLNSNDAKWGKKPPLICMLLDSLEMKKMIRLQSWQNGQENEITYVSIILYIYAFNKHSKHTCSLSSV